VGLVVKKMTRTVRAMVKVTTTVMKIWIRMRLPKQPKLSEPTID
jgi:hypothetical protein